MHWRVGKRLVDWVVTGADVIGDDITVAQVGLCVTGTLLVGLCVTDSPVCLRVTGAPVGLCVTGASVGLRVIGAPVGLEVSVLYLVGLGLLVAR